MQIVRSFFSEFFVKNTQFLFSTRLVLTFFSGELGKMLAGIQSLTELSLRDTQITLSELLAVCKRTKDERRTNDERRTEGKKQRTTKDDEGRRRTTKYDEGRRRTKGEWLRTKAKGEKFFHLS